MHLAKYARVGAACRDEAGSALLEVALCGSFVLLVILAMMECSLAVYTDHYVESAAASAARYAAVRGSTYSTSCSGSATLYSCEAASSDIQKYVQNYAAPAVTASKLSVTASWPGTSNGTTACDTTQGANSPGCVVTVTVSYPFTFILPTPFNKSITLSAVRSTVISQ